MKFLLAFLLSCSAFAQGLTLRDVAFVGSGGGGGGGGGTTGGGGSPAPAPTEYWDMDEVVAGAENRIGEVLGTTFAQVGGPLPSAAGMLGNAVKWTANNGSDLETDGTSGISYTSGNSISVSLWINHTTQAQAKFPFVYIEAGSGGVFIDDTGPGFTFYVYDGVDFEQYLVENPYTPDSGWHMWTLVYDGGAETVKAYVDATLLGTSPGGITLASDANTEFQFDGNTSMDETLIDEVYLHTNHALIQDEITWMYNAGSGRQYSDY